MKSYKFKEKLKFNKYLVELFNLSLQKIVIENFPKIYHKTFKFMSDKNSCLLIRERKFHCLTET